MKAKIALCALIVPSFLAATCPPSPPAVTVEYSQVGACNGYNRFAGPGGLPGTVVSAGGQAAFVVFRIRQIDNATASDFTFDPNRMFINGTSPAAHVDTSLSVAEDFNQLEQRAVTIPKETIRPLDGFAVAVAPTATTNGAVEASRTNYILVYDRGPSDPVVVLSKTNLNQTTWPLTENCDRIW